MLIVSAQRVWRGSHTAINSSAYESSGDLPRDDATGDVDAAMALASRGRLTRYDHTIRAGGNRVSAYLDVALDAVDAAAFDEAIRRAERELAGANPPLRFSTANAALELNLDIGEYGKAPEELAALAAAARRILLGGGAAIPVQAPALRIEVTRDAEGYRFALSAESARVVQAPPGTPRSISISLDDAHAFEETAGDLFPRIAQLLTGLDGDELVRRGTVELWDRATSRRLARIPADAA